MESNEEYMTDYLLSISFKSLNNENIVKNNVEKIAIKLSELDIEKEKHKYLCLSSIFGAFLGDSMGSCCEFSSPSNDNHKAIFYYQNGIFAPGEVTDDSEMAISAAFAYIDSLNEDPSIFQNILYYYFCVWRTSGPKDIGHATTSALRFWNGQSINETEFNYKMVKGYNWDSLANGFLMRISTFIAYYYYKNLENIYSIIQNYFSKENNEITKEIKDLYFNIYIESSKNTQITHPNYENGISSAVFTLMTLTGMVTNNANNVYSLFKKITYSENFFDYHKDNYEIFIIKNLRKKYENIIKEVESDIISPVFSMMGYYLHGFKLSVYFVKKLAELGNKIDEDTYYKIMCSVCDFGGDTDTNCAIVGAMIGPLIGYKNFKKQYFDTFIRFIPEERTQFNSAFMYIYVSYLEEKLLKKKEIMNSSNIEEKKEEKKEEKTEDKKEEKEEKTEEKEEKTEEKKEDKKEEKKEEKTEEKTEEKKEDKKEEKTEEKKSGGFFSKIWPFSGYTGKKVKFKNYTAFKKIIEFLTKEINY